jgi:hypothetical protein
MNKTAFIIALYLFFSLTTSAQVSITLSGDSTDPSAGLDVNFNNKGFLQPRLTGDQIQAIANPAAGLMVYNLSSDKPVYFDGTSWKNFDGTAAWFGCGVPLEIIHQIGLVAPVNKTVKYGTVTNVPGEPQKCWITSNLGSDRQATAVNDASESSAGWYWQFNREKGFKHDGTTRTPGTAWINSMDENSNWIPSHDPCALELGTGWRIPTSSEWTNVDNAGTWTNWNGLWNSDLKMHAAGWLWDIDGTLANRGSTGYYWSNTQYTTIYGYLLLFASSYCNINYYGKIFGFPVRCIFPCSSPPSSSPAPGAHLVLDTAITWKWLPVEGADGYRWNTIDDFNSALDMGSKIAKVETGLTQSTNYLRYVWAYNICGPAEASALIATTAESGDWSCGDPILVNHAAGAVAPVDKTVIYGTVTNIPGETTKCWITSNLGSDYQAAAVSDTTEASAGWYWQFNREQGFKHNGLTRTPNTAWISSINENSNWIPSHDPCAHELGTAWRIPTNTEWTNADNAGNWTDWNGPWNSDLKMHAAGILHYDEGSLFARGVQGLYWSTNQYDNAYSFVLRFLNYSCTEDSYIKVLGSTVRCIFPCNSPPSSSPAAGSHIVLETAIAWKWLPVAGANGYRWNTTDDFNSALEMGTDTTKLETGLESDSLYTRYVWAYNNCGHTVSFSLAATTDSSGVWECSDPILVNHLAGAIAPVNKTVIYNTVTNIPGEINKCWISGNLGSDRQATAVNDATEASAGWYWQFNREQGFKHDGTTRTPNSTWITGINENSNWIPSHDPCALELGTLWRIPTLTEWTNVGNAGSWTNWNGPWNSDLKMHAAGYLSTNGTLGLRGANGWYWSSNQYNTIYGYFTVFSNNYYNNVYDGKILGFPVRCIFPCNSPPSSPVPADHLVLDTAVTWMWMPVTRANGYRWNTTDDFSTAENLGSSTTKIETGLAPNTSYTRYVWAYNDCGITASVSLMATTAESVDWSCGDPIMVHHVAGAVAPVDKTVMYGTVTNIPGETNKCWTTSNLGSTRQATAVNDATEASAGWYWQFNREQGFKHDGTTRTPNTAWITSINENSNWISSLDPCALELGSGWRIPTSSEWTNVDNAGTWTNWNGPWNSALKMHAAGLIYPDGSGLSYRGEYGRYWSSSQNNTTRGYQLVFTSNVCGNDYLAKIYGLPTRCLYPCISPPSSSPTPGEHLVLDTAIAWKWLPVAGASRYLWSTTDDPGSALDMGGSTTKIETGLIQNTTYTRYVWAYNDCGITVSSSLTASTVQPGEWTCGDPILVSHVAGTVAPVDKTVMYGTVTNIPGETNKCWTTSNLGSDGQAAAVNDTAEASAGWYWQFNREQGFKHTGITRTPNTGWISSINENSNWISSHDPCVIELGTGWRIPTNTEWTNVDNAGNWTDWNGPWNSDLKLHAAGWLWYTSGTLGDRGVLGAYSSSAQSSNEYCHALGFNSSSSNISAMRKSLGFPVRCIFLCSSIPSSSPAPGDHLLLDTAIIWKWLPVDSADGYRWNTTDDFYAAQEMGTDTSKLETGLEINTEYTRYVWAYNACGSTATATFTAATVEFTCGDPVLVSHEAGTVAPVDKMIIYATVTNIPGENNKCWITSNLGADRQATAVNDTTEASAGWYWQFNREQGFKHDGTTLTPNTAWITEIIENSDWAPAHDPCALELGTVWRIPTFSEWTNVGNAGNWSGWDGPWNSGLKMHAAGLIYPDGGELSFRGGSGYYWSSTQFSNIYGRNLLFGYYSLTYSKDYKTFGYPVRCVRCNSAPSASPASGDHLVFETAIDWKWLPVADASGYKWNTTDDFYSALDIGTNTSKLETGLEIDSTYVRYVWAYNACGPAASATLTATTATPADWVCGDPILVSHITGTVAPVDKTAVYSTITNIPGETNKCWITRNLGSDRQATAVDDATEASAGWYWQFNREQGFKHDGTTRTPNTDWITGIDENSDWAPAHDPCALELGTAWRIPTFTEWTNVDEAGNWTDWNGPWDSELKMHAAGILPYYDGILFANGEEGLYWSSTQRDNENSYYLFFDPENCYHFYEYKTMGLSVRCLFPCNSTPSSSPVAGSHIILDTAVAWKWLPVTGATGYRWSATDDFNSALEMGTDTTKIETGLENNTLYTRYVWAYNACGCTASAALMATTAASGDWSCGDPILVNHAAGAVAPVDKTVIYGTVTNIPGETNKCWISSNLGSDRQATALNDTTEASAGWYWQFNREQGFKHDGTTRTPNTAWITGINENSSWIPSHDPCALELGTRWRIPTLSEWTNIDEAENWTNWNGPWNTALKMHAAGRLTHDNGTLYNRGAGGYYWSGTQHVMSTYYGYYLGFENYYCDSSSMAKTYGLSVRCIFPCNSPPSSSPGPDEHRVFSTAIRWKWTPVDGAEGYKWNTTDDFSSAQDMGTNISKLETGLTSDSTYTRCVWAYNACGHSESATFNATTVAFTCNDSIPVSHVADPVAPVDKTVIYGTVNNIPGETTKCWITSNLGSDRQANAVNDSTEASSGWYWQFNRKRGYMHEGGTDITPSWSLVTINENSNWTSSEDPCTIEMGTAWRLPTNTEWTNVDAAGSWTTWSGPWNSGLKLHAAGYVDNTNGQLHGRTGSLRNGWYWSSTQNSNSKGYVLMFDSGLCNTTNRVKNYGYPVRCIK